MKPIIRALFLTLLFVSTANAQLPTPESPEKIPSGSFSITPPDAFKQHADEKKPATDAPPTAAATATPTQPLPAREDSGLIKTEFLLSRGKFAEALQESDNVLKRHPNNADIYAYRGVAFRNLGDKDKALEQFKKALAINPAHLGANQYVGEMLVENGEIARAVEQLAVIHMICGQTDCEEETALESAINNAKKARAGK